MKRRQFLLGAAGQAALEPRPPNVVFLLADQWRAQTMPSAGDKQLHAPNLARLAREGVHFDRAYASYPLCSPSRSSLITGRFPHTCGVTRNNVRLPLEEPSIASQLRKAGYVTGYIGKWHLDGASQPGFVPPGPRRRGFDYWAAFNRGHRYYDSIYFRDTPDEIRPAGFEPDYQTELAADFIRKNKAKPFYLYLSWGPPHTPRQPPGDWSNYYDPEQFLLRPNVPPSYEKQARAAYAGYYGLCSALDQCLGRLLAVLDQENLAAGTLVVFTADHGDMLGSHGLDYNNVPFEESSRIPLLMRYPGKLAAGSRQDVLISNVDLTPTLLAMCGAEIPEGVQGRNHASLLLTGEGERPESIFAEGDIGGQAEWRMLVRGFDKLVLDRMAEVSHLYNLFQDPFEQNNLATSRWHMRTRDELLALMGDWQRRLEDGRTPSGLRKRP